MRRAKPALRILGERVRQYRKAKGLSQAELAQGICTQATISLIEKRNKVPSMNILMRLIKRLGVELDDVVVENRNETQLQLFAVDQKIRHAEYTTAQTMLKAIDAQEVREPEDQKQYNYYLGMVELFVTQDYDEAIYYFGRVLNPGGETGNYHDLPTVMAMLGLGLAYSEKGASDRARIYIEQALPLLKKIPFFDDKYLDIELTMYWHVARVYYMLNDYDLALQNAQVAIDLAVANDSLYLLDELYALRARTLGATHNADAHDAYRIAVALARLNQRQALVAELQAADEAASA